MSKRTPFQNLSRAQQAGILCNDHTFKRFVAIRMHLAPVTSATITTTFAAEFIRRQCDVSSRRDLDTSDTAAQRFDALRTDFDAWRGKIASPR